MTTGTSHHSDAPTPSSTARQANENAPRQVTVPRWISYSSSPMGASSSQAVTAAFTPPPLAATSSAAAAGQVQPRGRRTPR
jgi:hypothetical protein